jgi:hypothetical protein
MVKLPSKYSDIKRELAAYARKDEVKEIINKAHAMEVYAFQANDGELAEYTVEIRNRAERRLGQLMQSEPKAKGTRGQISGKRAGTSKGKGKARPVISGGVKNTPPEIKEKALKDQGIDKNLAKRARRAAPAYPAGRCPKAPPSMRRFFVYRLWPRRKRSEERIRG